MQTFSEKSIMLELSFIRLMLITTGSYSLYGVFAPILSRNS